ncbi:hypothetical protein Pmar_PMAR023639 [Perkinsus marinus ATCC 50983]|uniref:Uncharacterized protein n=1 Tax=Perkinsus marinus (strain ATCC 50983 / TXsc) TaxID=423536 RepID=C5KCW4_PERM5|nr:hypothetical protein Pmar_PMAR023639 [Perkinsus marinus ATCC 50983]EER17713.1 hypothetical protein Pmar_PMAR023639 [Perkinsus marinus ATCC 50983]|eukprot:XP_002785917.1 hypothetical protein Pmar_PMAR023639 [Perkinsus marinus ATCC 50983]
MARLAVKQYTTSGSQTIQSDEKAQSASSSDASRYFGNRTHKKICSGCGLPNLLPAPRCIACGKVVSDRDIRPVGQHDPLIEAVMVAKPTLAAKLKQNYRPQRLSRL